MVRAEGLEPPRLSSPEPKSGASTNSATPASRRLAWEDPPLRAPSISSCAARATKKRRNGAAWIPRENRLVPDQYGDGDGEQAAGRQDRRGRLVRLRRQPPPGREPHNEG